MDLKRTRRVHVGPIVTLLFENRDTIRFQIQEMARVERILTDEGIQAELDTTTRSIPEPGHLAATLFVELDLRTGAAGVAAQAGGHRDPGRGPPRRGQRRRRGPLPGRSGPRGPAHPRGDHRVGPLRVLRPVRTAGRAVRRRPGGAGGDPPRATTTAPISRPTPSPNCSPTSAPEELPPFIWTPDGFRARGQYSLLRSAGPPSGPHLPLTAGGRVTSVRRGGVCPQGDLVVAPTKPCP